MHCPLLIPFVQKLRDFITLHGGTAASRFQAELTDHLTKTDTNIYWMLGMYFRYAASLGNVTPDERDFLEHSVNPHIFKGLLSDDAWKDYFQTIYSIDREDDGRGSITRTYHLHNINYEMIEFTDDLLSKIFPVKIIYPFPGKGKFGVSFLVNCYLQGIYPVGFPTTPQKAHGTPTSMIGFAVHDLLHSNIDPRFDAVKAHILEEADAHFLKGGDARTFVRSYAPHAVRKYHVLMNTLQEIYHDFLTRLLPAYGKEEFTRTMNGFFLNVHEFPTYSARTFKTNDLEKIITSLTGGAVAALGSYDGLESPFDPLETSPITGESLKSKKEIITYAFYNYLLKDPRVTLPTSYYEQIDVDHTKFIHGLITKAKVKQSPRFIDVIFGLRTGQELKYTFLTLFHKIQNAEDGRGLLRMSGINIPPPDFLSLGSERENAQTYLKHISQHLQKLVEQFRDRAIFFANYKRSDGLSLADRYFNWHFNQEKAVKAKLEPKM